MRRCVASAIATMQDPASFVCVSLVRIQAKLGPWKHLVEEHGWAPVRRGRGLRTHKGWFAKGSFVLYRDHAPWGAGVLEEVFEATRGGETHMFLVIHQHVLVAAPSPEVTVWVYRPSATRALVSHGRVLHGAPFLVDPPDVRVILPLYAEAILTV